MLRAVSEREKGRILSLSRSPQLTVRLQALLSAYGIRQRFFETWVQNRDSFLMRLDGHFEFIMGPDAETIEIAVLLSCSRAFSSLSGEAGAVDAVAEQLPFNAAVTYYSILGFNSGLQAHVTPALDPTLVVDTAPRLIEVYDLLEGMAREGFELGSFDAWYVDFSHRLRHNCADVYLLRENGVPAACCLVTARSRHAGLIGGLATLPGRRGRGYATLLLGHAVSKICAAGLLPVLECGDDLYGFYANRGFTLLSRGATLRLAANQ